MDIKTPEEARALLSVIKDLQGSHIVFQANDQSLAFLRLVFGEQFHFPELGEPVYFVNVGLSNDVIEALSNPFLEQPQHTVHTTPFADVKELLNEADSFQEVSIAKRKELNLEDMLDFVQDAMLKEGQGFMSRADLRTLQRYFIQYLINIGVVHMKEEGQS
jgi:hypothetical protein